MNHVSTASQIMPWKVLALICVSLIASVPAQASKPNPHPLIGKWEWTLPNGCKETYEFRPSGTSRVTSGAEQGLSRFSISDDPDEEGFYEMTDEVLSTNDALSCSGPATPVGHAVTLFITFSPDQEDVLFCYEHSLKKCMGPLHRVSKP